MEYKEILTTIEKAKVSIKLLIEQRFADIDRMAIRRNNGNCIDFPIAIDVKNTQIRVISEITQTPKGVIEIHPRSLIHNSIKLDDITNINDLLLILNIVTYGS